MKKREARQEARSELANFARQPCTSSLKHNVKKVEVQARTRLTLNRRPDQTKLYAVGMYTSSCRFGGFV